MLALTSPARPLRARLAGLALAAAALAGLAAPAAAQEQGQGQGLSAQQSAWISRCNAPSRDAELECAVEVRVTLSNSGQLMAALTIRVPADTRSPVMMIHVPIGLYLPAGIDLKIDATAPVNFPLQTCDAGGCYAGGPVSVEMLDALRDGGTVTISFQNLNRQPINVPIGLTGFTAAYDKVE